MGKSLKDLFEISEEMDPKQELIADILSHTIDPDVREEGLTDKEIERNNKLKALAASVDSEESGVTLVSAKDDLRSILAADTDRLQADLQDGDIEEDILVIDKDSTKRTRTKNAVKKDPTMTQAKKKEVIDAIDKIPPGQTDTIKTVDEMVDDEGRMAKSDLLKLTQYSAKLYKALGDEDQLPAWIQAKITLAADYIGTVKHYLEGEQVMGGEEAPSGQLEEAAGDKEYYHWEDLHLDIFINKPVEEILDDIYLPLTSDARKMLSTRNYKRMLELPDDYSSKYGTKKELVERERGYLERDFYQWKDRFEDIEGDEEVIITCSEFACTVYVEPIEKASDAYSAGKAKGDTSDVYESSILKILSK